MGTLFFNTCIFALKQPANTYIFNWGKILVYVSIVFFSLSVPSNFNDLDLVSLEMFTLPFAVYSEINENFLAYVLLVRMFFHFKKLSETKLAPQSHNIIGVLAEGIMIMKPQWILAFANSPCFLCISSILNCVGKAECVMSLCYEFVPL